jgi:prevent-host-death family protein
MSKQVRATDAKNNFGGLLEDVALLGRVDIARHGRVVAVVLSPRELDQLARGVRPELPSSTHVVPAPLARDARIVGERHDFDED